jgi:hypothetical protein
MMEVDTMRYWVYYHDEFVMEFASIVEAREYVRTHISIEEAKDVDDIYTILEVIRCRL